MPGVGASGFLILEVMEFQRLACDAIMRLEAEMEKLQAQANDHRADFEPDRTDDLLRELLKVRIPSDRGQDSERSRTVFR